MAVEDAVSAATNCFNPNFKFPSILWPDFSFKVGLPSFVLGMFLLTIKMITFVFEFKIPSLDVMFGFFLGPIKLPKFNFDISGAINFIICILFMILKFFFAFLLTLLKPPIKLPTFKLALDFFLQIALDLNLNFKFECIPKTFFGIVQSLL